LLAFQFSPYKFYEEVLISNSLHQKCEEATSVINIDNLIDKDTLHKILGVEDIVIVFIIRA